MARKHERFTAEITGYTSEGQGVARAPDGMAVFVRDAIAGEVAEIALEHVGKTAAYGRIVRLETVSPHRVSRRCPLGKRCGGCAFWHMDYAEELRLKGQRVRDALARIGGVDPGPVEVLGGVCEGYRNKAQYPVAPGADGPVAGFYMARTHQVLPVERCYIQDPWADEARRAVTAWMAAADVPAYDELRHRGLVRHIYVRTAREGAQVCVVGNGPAPASVPALTERLRAALPDLRGVLWNVNTRRGNVVLGEEFQVLWGRPWLEETLCGLTFRLSPRSFFQVNRDQAERLYRLALDMARLGPETTALDLYCGTGTITLCMARRAGQVYGVEVVAAAVADAEANAARNGVENARFWCADAGEAAARFAREGVRPEVILVDPPRKGLGLEVIEAIAQMEPARIVYVSCDPATLARDVARLLPHGYRLEQTRAVDMFPRCAHVETVVLLSKLNTKQHIEVELNLDELDLTATESKATYEEIKAYVLEHTGLKVSHLYIAQVKQKYGIIERENYNKPKSESSRQPKCPPEKEAAIAEALKHFGMISE